jgi:hypothetical protein
VRLLGHPLDHLTHLRRNAAQPRHGQVIGQGPEALGPTHGLGPFGHGHQAKAPPGCLTLTDFGAHHVRSNGSRDQDHIGVAGHARLQRDEAGIAAHQPSSITVVALAGRLQPA